MLAEVMSIQWGSMTFVTIYDSRNTVRSTTLFGTEAYTEREKTLSVVVDCSARLRQRRGRPVHRWCCASTVNLAELR